MTRRVQARQDPAIGARIVRATPLRYAAGADARLDRPAHVRAGSGLAWLGERLAVVQDDASFVALVDPRDASGAGVDAIALPAGAGGRRQFDDTLGNKADKLDLEAITRVPTEDRVPSLLALGSGSTPGRETAVLLRVSGAAERDGVIRVHALPAFYARLRAAVDFSGSELNVEGAVHLGGVDAGRLRLFNRGNGAPHGGRVPVNATCDLNWRALAAHLAASDTVDAPVPFDVVQYDLGEIEGLSLTFTDAALAAEGDEVRGERQTIVYTAAAEASPDATRDGPVIGCAVGVIDDGSRGRGARWALLHDAAGRPFTGKVEGIALDPTDTTRAYVVVDRDAHDVASELCEVRLDGDWFP